MVALFAKKSSLRPVRAWRTFLCTRYTSRKVPARWRANGTYLAVGGPSACSDRSRCTEALFSSLTRTVCHFQTQVVGHAANVAVISRCQSNRKRQAVTAFSEETSALRRDVSLSWLTRPWVETANFRRRNKAVSRSVVCTHSNHSVEGRASMKNPMRCPYCEVDNEFKAMVTHNGGRFLCVKCGHVARPEDRAFKCHCLKCQELRFHAGVGSARPTVS